MIRLLLFGIITLMAVVTSVAQEANYSTIGDRIKVFPNPVSGDYVHVRMDQLNSQSLSFSVHSIIGNEVSVEIEKVDDLEVKIRVRDLVSGYYLITIKDAESKFRGTYKFLKH